MNPYYIAERLEGLFSTYGVVTTAVEEDKTQGPRSISAYIVERGGGNIEVYVSSNFFSEEVIGSPRHIARLVRKFHTERNRADKETKIRKQMQRALARVANAPFYDLDEVMGIARKCLEETKGQLK